MHFVKLFSFIFFSTLALHIQQASAECCYCPAGAPIVRCNGFSNCESLCYDGNRCTPYCARGSGGCNIFGCNCDGGCRTRATQSTVPLSPLESAVGDVFKELFKAADLNRDDLLSFEEWVRSVNERAIWKLEDLRERWNQFVRDGKDYLTRAEAESIRA